jgi:hypothetical protein
VLSISYRCALATARIDRGCFGRVEQCGEQPVRRVIETAVVELIVDHPDRHRHSRPAGRSSASQVPSARVSMWRGFMLLIARHNRSAPVAAALDHKGNQPQNNVHLDRVLLISVGFGSAVVAGGRGDWDQFVVTGKSMFAHTGWNVFARNHDVQTGPISLAAARILAVTARNGFVACALLCMLLAANTRQVIGRSERRTASHDADGHRWVTAVVLVGQARRLRASR